MLSYAIERRIVVVLASVLVTLTWQRRFVKKKVMVEEVQLSWLHLHVVRLRVGASPRQIDMDQLKQGRTYGPEATLHNIAWCLPSRYITPHAMETVIILCNIPLRSRHWTI